MKKRILAIIMSVCMIVTMIPCMAFADTNQATTLAELEDAILDGGTVSIPKGTTINIDKEFASVDVPLTFSTKVHTKIIVENGATLNIKSGGFAEVCMTVRGTVNVAKGGYLAAAGSDANVSGITVAGNGVINVNGGTLYTQADSGCLLNNSGKIQNKSTKYAGKVYIGCNDSFGIRYIGKNMPTKKLKGCKELTTYVYIDADTVTKKSLTTKANNKFGKGKWSFGGALNISYAEKIISPAIVDILGDKVTKAKVDSIKVQYGSKSVKIQGVPSSAFNVYYQSYDEKTLTSFSKIGVCFYEAWVDPDKKSMYSGNIGGPAVVVAKTPKISKVTVGSKKMTVYMGTSLKSAGGTKYVVQYRQKGTKTWKTVSSKSATITIKKLKKGKTYQVRAKVYAATPADLKASITYIANNSGTTAAKLGLSDFSGSYCKIKTTKKIK